VARFDVDMAVEQVQALVEKQEDGLPVFGVQTTGNSYQAQSVIVASGSYHRGLDVPGEVRLLGKGVSYCATCDGAFFKGKDLVVVGAGNTAVHEALFLTKFAKSVTVVSKSSKPLVENAKLRFVGNSEVVEVLGEAKVSGVKVVDTQTKVSKVIGCEGVFVCIGYVSNTLFLGDFIKKNSQGYVEVNDQMETSRNGVFACGDCVNKSVRQIVTACSDGAIAGCAVQKFLEKRSKHD
jgi:thioredoxin reductase (NADPH)